jgi:hypothetical protein
LLPDDIFMGNVDLLITKLTYTVILAPAAGRPLLPLTRLALSGGNVPVTWRPAASGAECQLLYWRNAYSLP